jgi:hypothetical protein
MLDGLDLKNVVSRLHGSMPLITMRGSWALPAKRKKGGIVVQCYMCRKFEVEDGSWRLMLPFNRKNVSHGLCPRCAAIEIARAKREAAELRLERLTRSTRIFAVAIEKAPLWETDF